MNPTQSFHLVKVLLLAVLATGLSTSLSSAQEFHGKFTLPFEARWGTVTLAPGDYTVELDPASRPYIAIRRGTHGEGFVMTSAVTDDTISGPSALLAVPTGDSYRIRMMHLAELGVTLDFTPPKSERTVLAQAPVLNRPVPILMASK